MSDRSSGPLSQPPGQRMVELQHGHNFRDIGGYRAGAATTRWGCIYRSGSLAWLSDADQDRLQARGISTICDLRSSAERLARPSRIQRLKPSVHWWREHAGSVAPLTGAVHVQGAAADQLRAMMIAFYRDLPFEQATSLSEIFRLMAAGRVPLIVHCSAGKDRTGVAIALLLGLLEVPRETIFEDYLLSERCFDQTRVMVLGESVRRGSPEADPRLWEPLLRADPDYLTAMFSSIRERCGSLDVYFDRQLGLDAHAREAIRRRLTS